ncbi:hypothetical protein QL285_020647 [Trifolium repens]|nr:hypothetical protein QL285_020647 [Trifolium repens]
MKIHETSTKTSVFKLAFHSNKNRLNRSCEERLITVLLEVYCKTRISLSFFQYLQNPVLPLSLHFNSNCNEVMNHQNQTLDLACKTTNRTWFEGKDGNRSRVVEHERLR